MFNKKKLIALFVIGVLTTTLVSSFTISFIHGDTSSEAVYIDAEQLNILDSKVGLLEEQQKE